MGEKKHHSAYIIIHGPGHDGTRLQLREGITSFGRLPSNDVILLGDLVSRHHARITYFEGRATLQDLGSHNGTFVNGIRVRNAIPINEGDLIELGTTVRFLVESIQPEPSVTPVEYDPCE